MFKIFFNKKNNNFYFHLCNSDGKLIFISKNYSDKDDLDSDINIIINNSIASYERKTTVDGKFYFIIKNNGGISIGKSGSYSSEAGMNNSINTIKNSMKKAIIKDLQ
ncbi:YegP family protein [Joostella atrarenae]|uniref:YegP family protein n=1 Tax=Joostella atrarenae TaxID=679257 RepID=A0ABS9J1A4_9FLAO|nr:YegP family protein [Joostella atrarenae]MCF8714135.1 YegP family protein [Joostella atrarenae]